MVTAESSLSAVWLKSDLSDAMRVNKERHRFVEFQHGSNGISPS